MKLTDESMTHEKATPIYIKYVLQKGSDFEKTRLIRNIPVSLMLQDRKIMFNND